MKINLITKFDLTYPAIWVRGIKYVGLAVAVLAALVIRQTVWAAGLVGQEAELVRLTNVLRRGQGLPALSVKGQLNASALSKANDMAVNGYFAHADAYGNRMSFWIAGAGYDYLRAGENLARGFNSTEEIIQAWIKSPTHYANLISPYYIEIGVGIAQGMINDKPTVFVVQHFGQPMPKVVIPAIVSNTPAGYVLGEIRTVEAKELAEMASSDRGKLVDVPGIVPSSNEAAVINTSPVGLVLVAYENSQTSLRGNILSVAAWEDKLPVLPYSAALSQRGYQLMQILVVLIWFAGGAIWLGRATAPAWYWLKRKRKFIIKTPSG